MDTVCISTDAPLERDAVLQLYRACEWSAAGKPAALMAALSGSHCVVTAWIDERLVGLGNAISDGALVAYFPHLLVHPSVQSRGVGSLILARLRQQYAGFHQQVLLAVDEAVAFYERGGLARAQGVTALWVYDPSDIRGAS